MPNDKNVMESFNSRDKKRRNNTIDKIFVLLFITPLLFLLFLVWADQITRVVNITFAMWLSLLAGYLTYYGTIVLAMVTVIQNRTISEISKKQMELQEKSLNESSRPYFHIMGYCLSEQRGINTPYYASFKAIPEDQQSIRFRQFQHYRINTDRELSEWLNNTDTNCPGILPFSIDIYNTSNATINELRFNSYELESYNIVPCEKTIDILEPDSYTSLEGFTNIRKDELDGFYSFSISYKNSFGKTFHEEILLSFLTDKDDNKLIINITHLRSHRNVKRYKVEEGNNLVGI